MSGSDSSPGSIANGELGNWVNKAKAGEQCAWIELDRALRPRLEAQLRARIPDALRSRFDVEDVLQSGFLEASRRLGDFEDRGEASFEAWLAEIMFNELRDKIRFHARDKRSVDREVEVASSVAARATLDSQTPSRTLANAEAEAGLAQSMSELEDSDRTILRLRFQDGLSWAEIARRTGIAETTVRRRGTEAVEALIRNQSGAR